MRVKNSLSGPSSYALYLVAALAVTGGYGQFPTRAPMGAPPTKAPSTPPTKAPSKAPTKAPTKVPTTAPTTAPTKVPTKAPTEFPTSVPTKSPTEGPTKSPSKSPTRTPTTSPTQPPTSGPTRSPTMVPTFRPTPKPTQSPTVKPTRLPTVSPTIQPTFWPTMRPSPEPTAQTPAPVEQTPQPAITTPAQLVATNVPTRTPTARPTVSPTGFPTQLPTRPPTRSPTRDPSGSLTQQPTSPPNPSPTKQPSAVPSTPQPTKAPTRSPSVPPTLSPSTVFPKLSREAPTLPPKRTVEVNGRIVIMRNAAVLSPPELDELETLMEDWFSDYYNDDEESCQQRQRRYLQRIRDDRVVTTDIEFVRQDVTYDENGVPTNTITYNQQITYADGSTETIVCSGGGGDPETPQPVNLENLTPEDVAALPFEDFGYSQELVEDVQEKIVTLRSVEGIATSPRKDGDSTGVSAVVVAAIVIVGVGGVMAMAYVAIKLTPWKSQPPATQEEGVLEWDG